MSASAIFLGFMVFGMTLAACSYYINNYKDAQQTAAHTSRLINLLRSGSTNVKFIFGEIPLVIYKNEKVLAALPNTALLEPKLVRVRQGSRYASRGRLGGFSNYSSTTESREQLKQRDVGTLVVTDQRVAFLGQLKTVSIDAGEILGVDTLPDGVALHCKSKENVESFKISPDLMVTYAQDLDEVSVPFTGAILGCIIDKATEHTAEIEAAIV
jgi:hypothetical protein